MGVTPEWGPPEFKLFNLLSWTHKIFKIIKLNGRFWDTKMGGILNRGLRNSKLFNHTRSTHEKRVDDYEDKLVFDKI